MNDWIDTVTTPVINLLGKHPVILLAFLGAALVVSGVRTAYPLKTARPRWAAFLLGLLDPLALNLWDALRWALAKAGVTLRSLPEDPPSGTGKLDPPKESVKTAEGGG